MGRMTEKGHNGYYIPADRGGATMIYAPQAEVKQRYEGEIVDRMGEYEKCGLEPEEVWQMAHDWTKYETAMSYVDELGGVSGLKQLRNLCIGDDGEQLLKLDEIIALAKAKKEGRCIILDSPLSGTAQVMVGGKLEERKVKEVVVSKTGETTAVTVVVDEAKGKKEYPEYILRYLRQRRGMKPDDTSRDEMFQSMEPKRVFWEVVHWNGLLGGYDRTITKWIKDIYGVDLDEQTS